MRRLFTLGLLGLILLPGVAQARSTDVVLFRYEQVWGAAVRLIRVDRGFKITDQDRDVGFVLFEYNHAGHRAQGSLELVRVEQDGRQAVRVAVHLAETPSYLERLLLDHLGRKLKSDFGAPEAPPERAPERPKEPEAPAEESPEGAASFDRN